MMRLAALALALSGGAASAECRADRVTVSGGFGQANFAVEVADDPEERAQGLMFREEMGTLEGMLFVYDEPGSPMFWMRNTLIPLDMIFAGPDGRILYVHEEAVPGDETGIRPGDGVQYVLEVNGGLARRLGIAVGDAMQHPAIGEGAALPCP
jgi:hypothetical protein